jgi:hypothetical protein
MGKDSFKGVIFCCFFRQFAPLFTLFQRGLLFWEMFSRGIGVLGYSLVFINMERNAYIYKT